MAARPDATHTTAAPFVALGREIEAALAAAGGDLDAFPVIAARALEHAEDLPPLDHAAFCDLLARGEAIPQSPPYFSDLPLTLYEQPAWRLEVLLWNNATTEIHGHRFRGAFRLLRGSSLHAEWTLTREQDHGPRLSTGHGTRRSMEVLRRGDVRTIPADPAGLVHSLFHLERPSITLVARTHVDEEMPAQPSFLRPSLIVAGRDMSEDPRYRALAHALHVARQLEDEPALDRWVEGLARLDGALAAYLTVKRAHDLRATGRLARALDVLVTNHDPTLVDSVRACAQHHLAVRELVALRSAVHDAEERLLLALLLNCDAREEVLHALAVLRPEADARAWLAAALRGLCDPERLMDTVVGAHRGSRVDGGPTPLAIRLVQALHLAPAGSRDAVIEAVAAGGAPPGGGVPEAAARALAAFRAEPGLAPLFS